MLVVPLAAPSLWGNAAWHFLHAVASTFPQTPTQEDKQHYYMFFRSVGPVLPCKICRPYYTDYLRRHNLWRALSSRMTLANYFHRFHNHVNRRLGKKQFRKSELNQYFQSSSSPNEHHHIKVNASIVPRS